jgi:integrase
VASIVKRTASDGSYRYDVRYRTPAGTPRKKTFKRRKDADRYANTVEADKVRGAFVDPRAGRITLTTYAAEWIEHRPALRPRTVELYESLLRLHIESTFGRVELAQIGTADVRAWHAKLIKADRPGATTVAKAYRLLRAILNTAVEDDLIVKNPANIKGAGVEASPERPTATSEQVWALADAIEPRFRCMVLGAAFLGLRYGELTGLSRRHVNLLHRTVTVERQLIERAKGVREFGPPKSAVGARTIAIPAPLVSELEHHLANYAAPGADGLVFVGERGAMLARGNWHPAWDAARSSVDGLPDGFRFHDLRHTSNTIAAATGASTRELMHRMGHASPAAALRYQHATAERDREVADRLGEVLTQPTLTSSRALS